MPLSIEVHHADALARGLAAQGVRCNEARSDTLVVGVASNAELDALTRLLAVRASAAVLVVVPEERSEANAQRALASVEVGARALVSARADVERVATALRRLRTDPIVIDDVGAELLMLALRARVLARERFALTAREREVLALLVDGKTAPAIARVLGIGVATVHTHVKNLYRKLDVESRAQATAVALRYRLL